MIHHERLRPPARDYPADEWNIIEKGFHPEFLAQLETMLAVGNGYLGMRGCPEEGGPNAENSTLINGFYETHPIMYGEEAYGFAKTGQSICNVTDAKIIKLFVDDEPFWLPDANLLSYDRRLNMKSATLDRDILWETPARKARTDHIPPFGLSRQQARRRDLLLHNAPQCGRPRCDLLRNGRKSAEHPYRRGRPAANARGDRPGAPPPVQLWQQPSDCAVPCNRKESPDSGMCN